MKKILGIVALFLGLTVMANAQDNDNAVKRDVKKGTKAVSKGAKKVGHKTAEVASKSKAKITDETYKDKVGPNKETIYIDNHSKYYYVDKLGHRHYVTESQLRNKDE